MARTKSQLVDSKGIKDLRKALDILKTRYNDEKANGDILKMEIAEKEILGVEKMERAAIAKGGRLRQFTSYAERCRKNICKRITYSLEILKLKHPPLYEHLSKAITTGVECSYNPNNDPQ